METSRHDDVGFEVQDARFLQTLQASPSVMKTFLHEKRKV